MIIREPAIYATSYYLRETPGDSPTRRHERHAAFVEDAGQMLTSLAGWLSMPAPALPTIPEWEQAPPETAVVLAETGPLQGKVNASAWLRVYALRNVIALRVILARTGEHDQHVWPMLDEALGDPPQTPWWLHTTRYWCGIAPRPPEDLEPARQSPIQTAFGVLCLAPEHAPHVLVYPDARTENRAVVFLNQVTPVLDWYPIQARYRQDSYDTHASDMVRAQRVALDRVAQSVTGWPGGAQLSWGAMRAQTVDLETLESTYSAALDDLLVTQTVAEELSALAAGYRLVLKESGLWEAAPAQWEAKVAAIEQARLRVEADLHHITYALRQVELVMRGTQLRAELLTGERLRLLIVVLAALGAALLAVLIVDSDPLVALIRLVLVLLVVGIAAGAWWWSQRRSGS